MQPDPSVRKVLIYRLCSLGDTVVTLPCLHHVARAFPCAERRLLTNVPIHAKAPAAAAVVGESGLVHGYLRYTIGTRNPAKLLRLVWRIRRFNPEMLVYLQEARGDRAARRDAAFFRLSGVRRIIGLPLGELGVNAFDPATGLYESEASRLARCLRPLGEIDLSDPKNWDLRLTDAEHCKAGEVLAACGERPILACGPGTKMQAKDWGMGNWRALLGRIGAEFPGRALVLVGAREDSEASEYAAAAWPGIKVNLCGALTPRETAAVLERATIFLGPDSGPMHLAACAGVPCVIAFSARDRRGRWFPNGRQHKVIYHQTSCHGCYLEVCTAEQRRCLSSISVAEMAEAVAAVLNAPVRRPAAV